jgi:hypothetical protein
VSPDITSVPITPPSTTSTFGSIELQRDELYELVWSESVEKVAAKFGISGRGLAKICERFDVPVPPRGYWAQLQHGYKPECLSLLPASRGVPTTVTIRGDASETERAPVLAPEILAHIQREQQPAHRIQVAERLARPHPRIRATRDALKGATPDKYSLVAPFVPRGETSRIPLLDVSVNRASVPRALCIADALLKALAARGFVSRDLQVSVLGQTIGFGIREAVKQISHVPTPKELEEQRRWSWSRSPRWDHEPTGRLILKIDEFTRARLRKTWSDRDGNRLEDILNEVIAAMVLVADAKRSDERERRREEEERREAERRRYELERQRREEEARRQELDSQVECWVKSQKLRAFLDAAERTAVQQGHSPAPDSEFKRWLDWGRGYAEQLDPLPQVSS